MAIRILESAALRGGNPLRVAPFLASQTGTVSGSSTASTAFNAATTIVTVQTDETCHVSFGPAPTATTGNFKVLAGETHDFAVTPGDKVAWISG